MNDTLSYLGTAAISISLAMLLFGPIPQTYAGSVPPPTIIESELSVLISCGITISGSADFGLVSFGETIQNSDVTLSNPGTGTAQVSANVGQSLVSSPLAGGYAGTTDQTTHISPSDITLQIDSQGRVTMNPSSSNVLIGELGSIDNGILEVGVTINPINLPTSDSVWQATFSLTVSGCALGATGGAAAAGGGGEGGTGAGGGAGAGGFG